MLQGVVAACRAATTPLRLRSLLRRRSERQSDGRGCYSPKAHGARRGHAAAGHFPDVGAGGGVKAMDGACEGVGHHKVRVGTLSGVIGLVAIDTGDH